MTKAKPKASMIKIGQSGTHAVDAFMASLDHPLKSEIEAIRRIIGRADTGITENVKWNAPSFVFKDDFATLKFRPQTPVQVVIHTGTRDAARPGGGDEPQQVAAKET
jgi:hypothetical protein